MSKISHHFVDLAFVQSQFDDASNQFPEQLEKFRKSARNVDMLIYHAIRPAAYGSLVSPRSPSIASAIRVIAQASAAMYVSGYRTPVTLALGPGEPVTFTQAPRLDSLGPSRWILGFLTAALCRDKTSMALLCGVPPEVFRISSGKQAEYNRVFVEALRSFGLQNPNCPTLALEAMRLTDPEREDIVFPECTLFIDIHLIRLLSLICWNDSAFESGLAIALADHKTFWSTHDPRVHAC